MNEERETLYEYMRTERVNIEMMFSREEDEDPVISCRLREWSAGRNASRMILAGGRTLDEALAYAYEGLYGNMWIPLDWKLRAASVGIVTGVSERPIPIRRPISVSSMLRGLDDWTPVEAPQTLGNGPQNGSQRDPKGNNGKGKPDPAA